MSPTLQRSEMFPVGVTDCLTLPQCNVKIDFDAVPI